MGTNFCYDAQRRQEEEDLKATKRQEKKEQQQKTTSREDSRPVRRYCLTIIGHEVWHDFQPSAKVAAALQRSNLQVCPQENLQNPQEVESCQNYQKGQQTLQAHRQTLPSQSHEQASHQSSEEGRPQVSCQA